MQLFSERFQVVPAFSPVNLATTAAGVGDWVNFSDVLHATLLFVKGVGAAGEDPTITLQQAKTAAGGSNATFLGIKRIDKKQTATDLTATGTFTKVTQTAAATFTHTDLAEQAAVILIDIDPCDLTDGFNWVQATIADVGSTEQVGCLVWLLEMKHAQETLLTVIA